MKNTKPASTTVGTKRPTQSRLENKEGTSEGTSAGASARWDAPRVLAEARKRTKAIADEGQAKARRMMEDLLREAGWSDSEFLAALLKDVTQTTAGMNQLRNRVLKGRLPRK